MTPPRWKKLLTSVAVQRSSQTLASIADNVYVYGGELRPREPVDSSMHRISIKPDRPSQEVLSTAASSIAVFPQPRVGAASTAVAGKVYVFSGRGGTAMAPIEEAGSFWVFDPIDDTWSELGPNDPHLPYPVGRSYHSLANNGIDTLFLHAGCPEKGRLRDFWSFNISDRQWQELPPAPGPERGGTSIAYADGKIFRMNGFDGKTEQGGALDIFDPATNRWQTLEYRADGSLGPGPRSVSCLLSLSILERPSLVTMFGECDPSSLGHQGAGKMLADVWLFDIALRTWEELQVEDGDNKPPARGWFAADVCHTDDALHPSIVVQGGLAESNTRLDDAWLLTF